MIQTILNENGCKEETTIERLYRLRTEYYLELMQEMCDLRQKRIELITNFKSNIVSIDDSINKIQPNKLQSMNKRLFH